MSDSEYDEQPSESPDFSSLADQVEESSLPWQLSTGPNKEESNADLAYTVDPNFKSTRVVSKRMEMKSYFYDGFLWFVVGMVLNCASLFAFPAGAIIFTGVTLYGFALICLAIYMWMKQPLREETVSTTAEEFYVCRETPADRPAIHALHVQAFCQEDEARLVDELRAEGFATLSLVANAGMRVIGHVLFSPIEIVSPAQSVRALALAPVGVLPEWQGHGVATGLIRQGLGQLTESGERIVIVLGDPKFYTRFGFRPELTAALQSPYAGEHFMALELSPGALAGVTGEVRYAAPFGRLG